jgi:hypothetical protein
MALDQRCKHYTIYLLRASRSTKYAIYIVELEAIKKSAGEGVLLSQLQHIAEVTSPVRSKKEEQEADHSYPLWTVSYSSFSRHMICCALSVHSTSQVPYGQRLLS